MARRAVWRRRPGSRKQRRRRRRRRPGGKPLGRRSKSRAVEAIGTESANGYVAYVGEVEVTKAQSGSEAPRRQKSTTEGVGETEVHPSRKMAVRSDPQGRSHALAQRRAVLVRARQPARRRIQAAG